MSHREMTSVERALFDDRALRRRLADIGTLEEIVAAMDDAAPAGELEIFRHARLLALGTVGGRPRHELRRIVAAWRARHPRGGAPAGTGLTVERVVAAVIERREPDGTWPTQATVAESLGVTDRRIRAIASPVGGWHEILERAKSSG
jgi:hypothetical protein